jgi:hypothetical protein
VPRPFFVWLVALTLWAAPGGAAAADRVYASAQAVEPLAVGAKLPEASLRDVDGRPEALQDSRR